MKGVFAKREGNCDETICRVSSDACHSFWPFCTVEDPTNSLGDHTVNHNAGE